MRKFNDGAFGSGFVPGKVKEDAVSATQAFGHRWSGMPAKTPVNRVGERPPDENTSEATGTSTWTSV